MKLNKRTISNIATYFFGIAIGLVLVGMIMRAKQRYVQPPAEQPSAQETPAPGTPESAEPTEANP